MEWFCTMIVEVSVEREGMAWDLCAYCSEICHFHLHPAINLYFFVGKLFQRNSKPSPVLCSQNLFSWTLVWAGSFYHCTTHILPQGHISEEWWAGGGWKWGELGLARACGSSEGWTARSHILSTITEDRKVAFEFWHLVTPLVALGKSLCFSVP